MQNPPTAVVTCRKSFEQRRWALFDFGKPQANQIVLVRLFVRMLIFRKLPPSSREASLPETSLTIQTKALSRGSKPEKRPCGPWVSNAKHKSCHRTLEARKSKSYPVPSPPLSPHVQFFFFLLIIFCYFASNDPPPPHAAGLPYPINAPTERKSFLYLLLLRLNTTNRFISTTHYPICKKNACLDISIRRWAPFTVTPRPNNQRYPL